MPQVTVVQRTTTGDPALASVERFNPTELRCEVLRRFALETSRNAAAGLHRDDQPTWVEEGLAQLLESARQSLLRLFSREPAAAPDAAAADAPGGLGAPTAVAPPQDAGRDPARIPSRTSGAQLAPPARPVAPQGSGAQPSAELRARRHAETAAVANSGSGQTGASRVAPASSAASAPSGGSSRAGSKEVPGPGSKEPSGPSTVAARSSNEVRPPSKTHSRGSRAAASEREESSEGSWSSSASESCTLGSRGSSESDSLSEAVPADDHGPRPPEAGAAQRRVEIQAPQAQAAPRDAAPAQPAEEGQRKAPGWLRSAFESLLEYVKISTFLAFPNDSLFADPCIEELYQRHRMQQGSPRLDWSAMALLQMLLWDVAANPTYRLCLVLYFYGSFITMVLMHKLAFVAGRERPLPWRKSRGVLLCSFLIARGVVCHPMLTSGLPADPAAQPAREAAQSGVVVIGLGMTNLSAVLALQLHTLDTLILCVTHGIACACWAGLALQITSSDAWHTLVAGHLLVACVCVWQQYEQERFDRNSFEQELLMERGTLLHSSDCLVRQGTQADFNTAMQILYKARAAERVNF